MKIFFDPRGALRLDFKIEEPLFCVIHKSIRFIDGEVFRQRGRSDLSSKLASAKA